MLVQAKRISDSCGYAVPFMEYKGDRRLLAEYFGRRDEEFHVDYVARKNATSIDGLPAVPVETLRGQLESGSDIGTETAAAGRLDSLWPLDAKAATVRAMRFDPEQEELRRTVRTLLERAAGGDVWRLLAEQVGALGLAIPEEYGGAGFSVLETHVVLEELGAALAAPEFLSTTLAAQAILAGDSAEAKAELLPGIAEGETRAALVWGETVEAAADGTGWQLTGVEEHVLDGGDADLFVVPARMPNSSRSAQEQHAAAEPAPDSAVSAAVGLFVVSTANTVIDEVETVDPGRPQTRVEFRHSPATLLSAEAPLDRILDLAASPSPPSRSARLSAPST